MTESEAFAIIGCNSLDELDDQLELIIFSVKQKIITKPFHSKVFKKYSDEIIRYKEAVSTIKKDPSFMEVQVAFNTLSDKNPTTLIENFLEQKQNSLLAIANSINFFTLESNLNLHLMLHQNWISSWLKYIELNVSSQQLPRPYIDDMQWVRFKQLIVVSDINSWELLTSKEKKSAEIEDLLEKISSYFHHLTK